MRRWLAKLICPEAFKEAADTADRLQYLRHSLDELKQWCGYGFPEIAAAVEWTQKSERVHFMPLAEYDAAVAEAQKSGNWSPIMVGGIDKFRDEISTRFDRRPGRAA
ncbi:hypothetical protein [Methylobacterium aquaticum]|uniref:hypothetical protein n=1 Tax=Methylobacterium aquaticum TaxID=270351 RepID=UPI0019316C72|nr:hypothetical protein [Methylobacterium aquaticum]QRE75742.1 hypothetical protein F1D61_21120 [Methylobacterium aquaticum]